MQGIYCNSEEIVYGAGRIGIGLVNLLLKMKKSSNDMGQKS